MAEQERDDRLSLRAVQAENDRWFLWRRNDEFEWETVGECDVIPLGGAVTITKARLAEAIDPGGPQRCLVCRVFATPHGFHNIEKFVTLLFTELQKER